ncbi:MAG: hypothetical protein NVSMB45_17390 [Ginsengibacter sp.]
MYLSGVSGGFGIVSKQLKDSLTLSFPGYEKLSTAVRCDQYQNLVLKAISEEPKLPKQKKLASVTKDLDVHSESNWVFGNESYNSLIENEFIPANEYPNTGFALRIDKASYSNIRRFINEGSPVPKDAIRIEEMLNYFNFNYKEPINNNVFSIESTISDCPWNKYHELMFININARKINLANNPASNFVFLVDISGSMDMPNKLPLLKESFQLLVKNLRDTDVVSIVTYGGSVSVWLPPTSGRDKQKIIRAIEQLSASGDTPGEAGIRTAYSVAKSVFIPGGNNRIILASDGDFNVGITSDKDLEILVSKEKQSGVKLTCLGVGMGNYKDSKMEGLAKMGNGNFAYLDNIKEAEKFLVKELTQSLYSVAYDVFLDVNFKSSVKQYRLIGYDNKEEILSEKTAELEGGEIGSGNSTTAIFEFVATDSNRNFAGEIANLNLKYKLPNDSSDQQMGYVCKNNYVTFENLDSNLKFASSVVMYGLLLRESKFISYSEWDHINSVAIQGLNPSNFLETQFLELVENSKDIYLKRKKNKKRKNSAN